jgi:heme peroxidase
MSAWNDPGTGTTPTGPPSHGERGTRGLDSAPQSNLPHGRFGRMFRNLPVFDLSDDPQTLENQIEALAASMIQETEPDKPLDADDEDQNPEIPAGYTYFGQFIDHDITFDPVSSLQRQNDPDALEDFRTPRFDLDSIYGRGPADQPYLYQPDDKAKLALGRPVDNGSGQGGFDLIRFGNTALIGDPRNDENVIVSQLQSAFLRFHNAVVDRVREQRGLDVSTDVLKEAQRLVRWHYQWVVVHDFLRDHIVGSEVVDDILRPVTYKVMRLAEGAQNPETDPVGPVEESVLRQHLLFYKWANKPFMPVEFSAAAYRFGHSMVRPSYFFNDFVRRQTEPNRTPIFSDDPNPLANLNGFRPLPDDWAFDWKYFFDTVDEQNLPQPSYRIDDELVHPLGTLPGEPPAPGFRSLARRNLRRGIALGLPSGQTVSRAMGIEPLSDAELDLEGKGAPSFVGNAPLWYYVLRESKLRCGGRRLGPVGGRIVAEVLIGLLAGDPLSYLRVEPNWQPTLGPELGHFAMPDLLRFAGAA